MQYAVAKQKDRKNRLAILCKKLSFYERQEEEVGFLPNQQHHTDQIKKEIYEFKHTKHKVL